MSENRKQIDLVIIGAGPAGISTALHLLQIDPRWSDRMVILEKAQHPRHKLCGGGLTYFGLRVLKQLGISNPLPVTHVLVDVLHFRYHDMVFHAQGSPLMVVYHRIEFDDYLVSLARQKGVSIHENERVITFEARDDGVRVETDRDVYQTQAVVCADGSKGVSRRLMINEGSSHTARALETFLPIDERLFTEKPAEVIFDFSPFDQALQGYFW